MRESHGLFLKEVFLYFVCTEVVVSANYFTRCIIAVGKGGNGAQRVLLLTILLIRA